MWGQDFDLYHLLAPTSTRTPQNKAPTLGDLRCHWNNGQTVADRTKPCIDRFCEIMSELCFRFSNTLIPMYRYIILSVSMIQWAHNYVCAFGSLSDTAFRQNPPIGGPSCMMTESLVNSSLWNRMALCLWVIEIIAPEYDWNARSAGTKSAERIGKPIIYCIASIESVRLIIVHRILLPLLCDAWLPASVIAVANWYLASKQLSN